MAKKKEQTEEATESSEAAFELAKKAIEKKYGDVVSTLSDHGDMHIPTISTGCLSLDIALGCGGMGLGRIYEVYGPNSSGKSTLGVNVVIQGQRRGMRCCYIDAEHAVDPKLFRSYGVDTEKLQLVQGYDGEENLDILERFIKTGAFSVAIVDSVSALVPRVEAESDIDEQQMGLQARLMSKALRKITPIANQTQTLIIFINQLRMKIGAYGNPETTTGGESLAFYATGRISVRGPEAKNRRISDDSTGEVIGHKTLF
jgi:recombination protein RecA